MINRSPKFFACEKCHVIIEQIHGDKNEYSCDGINLVELTPNTSEGAMEKHMPVVEVSGNEVIVKVGSVFHPMTTEHSIEWVYLETEKGSQRMNLKADEEPVAKFAFIEGDRPIAAYAYCNLHGFWKTNI